VLSISEHHRGRHECMYFVTAAPPTRTTIPLLLLSTKVCQ